QRYAARSRMGFVEQANWTYLEPVDAMAQMRCTAENAQRKTRRRRRAGNQSLTRLDRPSGRGATGNEYYRLLAAFLAGARLGLPRPVAFFFFAVVCGASFATT